MDTPTFLRLFQLRTAQIMWFLGAGASRSAGIKTADDMIWDFKQRLYRSEKKLSPSAITDIGESVVRRKLQAHFDALKRFPPAGSESEYSGYFQATYPSPRDRRTYIEDLIATARPSFGHLALALLMAEKLCRVVWTTNFDRTIEDAVAKVFGGTGHLVTADLGQPQKLRQACEESRWPILGKLHGDYHSEELKNTHAELREQDGEMCQNLINTCGQNGLAVVGYSGRDKSVMDAFMEALSGERAFPGGLFWFTRSQDEPFRAVTELIDRARGLGIDAHLVVAEGFDELLVDVVRYCPQTADKLQTLDDTDRPRLRSSTPRVSVRSIPAIRTNALAVTSLPAMCRIVACSIGGYREIEAAILDADVDIIAHRIRDGVLAFGRDADVTKAFDPFNIETFDTHPLSAQRFVRETGERALVRDALFRALGKQPKLQLQRRGRTTFLLPNLTHISASDFASGNVRPVDRVSGTIPKTSVPWTEACALRIDYRLDQMWLLLEPTVFSQLPDDAQEDVSALAREFRRERVARRYNRDANAMLDGWISLICDGKESIRLRTFGIGDGVDAEFELLRTSGFSGTGRR